MYESESKGISWYGILRKLLILILLMFIIFAIVYFINGHKKSSGTTSSNVTTVSKESENKKETKTNSKESKLAKLNVATKDMQNASMEYFEPSNLPTRINESKTVKLKELKKKNIINKLKTSDGKTCNARKSTATVKRLKENYSLTTVVKCGRQKVKKTIYVGCFENCLDGICRGTKNSTGGICRKEISDTKTTDKNKKESTVKESTNKESTESTTNQNKNSDTKTNNNSNNSNTTPSTNTGGNNTTNNNSNKGTNSTNSGSNNSSNNTTNSNNTNTNSNTEKPLTTYYEYQRCTNRYVCTTGHLNSNNECVTTKNKNYIDTNGHYFQSTISSYSAPTIKTTCEKTWSTNPNLPGWNRTGNAKQE